MGVDLRVGPLTTYWWLRSAGKVLLWTWYLYQVSRLRLNLVPSHPDSTGGIGFLSDAQTKFGWVILAYGISYVAPTLLYKLRFEGASFAVLSVWGYTASFVVGAPLMFTLPLFMFTRQLYHAKSRALEAFQERSMEPAGAFEEKWLKACSSGHYELMSGSDLLGLNALNQVYDHIHQEIRVRAVRSAVILGTARFGAGPLGAATCHRNRHSRAVAEGARGKQKAVALENTCRLGNFPVGAHEVSRHAASP